MAIIYTHNGGPNAPHVFSVDVPSGDTVGTFNVTAPGPGVVIAPRAIRLDWMNGDLYLADIGDSFKARTDICLWKVKEPGPGDHGTLPGAVRYPIQYPFGPTDAEALAINPLTGVSYIITKEAVGKLVRLPKPLTGANLGVNMNKNMPANVTDACFTLDAKWLLIRAENVKDTIVYNASTFAFAGYITTPLISGGRAITMEPNGKSFLVGSEGQHSPLYRIFLPSKFGGVVTPAPPVTPADPTPGTLTTIDDTRIGEASGMAYSKDHSGVVWVHNDEGQNPQVYAVSISSGATVGTFGISGSALVDPEAIRVHPVTGAIWLADIGDNDNDKTDRRLVVLNEPALGNQGVLSASRHPISYPQGPQNAEALLIHPTSGAIYIITKAAVGRLYRLTLPASTTSNMLVNQNKPMPANVTDATYTTDGRFVLIRCADVKNTLVYSSNTWTKVGEIATPDLDKGESITVEPGGKSFLVGSEGLHSPIIRVLIPTQWRPTGPISPPTPPPAPPPTPTPCNAATTKPKDIINLRNWKLQRPVEGNDISANQLVGGYEDPKYFYTKCPGPAVVFYAPVGGSTTSNSDNPRSELREMRSNGSDEAGWNMASGTHTMEIWQAFTKRPNRGSIDPVVGGQIHDSGNNSDDITVCRLDGPNVVATRGDRSELGRGAKLLIANYRMGTYFRLKMVAGPWGVRYFIGGKLVATQTMSELRNSGSLPNGTSGMYFKAGAYTQANSENGTGAGEVWIKSLTVTHT